MNDVTPLKPMKNRGGRGHPGKYKTDVMRIPIPIRKQVQTLINRYQQYLETTPNADPLNPPDFLDLEKDVKAIEPSLQGVQEVDNKQLAWLLQLTPDMINKTAKKTFSEFKNYCFDRGVVLLEIKRFTQTNGREGKTFIIAPIPEPNSPQ